MPWLMIAYWVEDAKHPRVKSCGSSSIFVGWISFATVPKSSWLLVRRWSEEWRVFLVQQNGCCWGNMGKFMFCWLFYINFLFITSNCSPFYCHVLTKLYAPPWNFDYVEMSIDSWNIQIYIGESWDDLVGDMPSSGPVQCFPGLVRQLELHRTMRVQLDPLRCSRALALPIWQWLVCHVCSCWSRNGLMQRNGAGTCWSTPIGSI